MVTSTKAAKPEVKPEPVRENLDLDKKVTIRSIAEWETTFVRRDNGADVRIARRGTFTLPRNEIIAQCNSGNRLFLGTDNVGSHATLIIEDDPTRIELGFISEDGSKEQLYYSDELLKQLFTIANQEEFEKEFVRCFVSRSEYSAVMDGISRLGLNDYKKIRFIEKYTGFSL